MVSEQSLFSSDSWTNFEKTIRYAKAAVYWGAALPGYNVHVKEYRVLRAGEWLKMFL